MVFPGCWKPDSRGGGGLADKQEHGRRAPCPTSCPTAAWRCAASGRAYTAGEGARGGRGHRERTAWAAQTQRGQTRGGTHGRPLAEDQGHQGPLGSHVHLHPSPHQPRPLGSALTRPQEAPVPRRPTYTHTYTCIFPERKRESRGFLWSPPGCQGCDLPQHPLAPRWLPGDTWSDPPTHPGRSRTGPGHREVPEEPGRKNPTTVGTPLRPSPVSPLPVCATRAGRSPAYGQRPEGQWRIKSIHPRSPHICEGSKKHRSPFATGNQLHAASKPSFPTQRPENLYPTPAHVHARTHTLHPFTP